MLPLQLVSNLRLLSLLVHPRHCRSPLRHPLRHSFVHHPLSPSPRQRQHQPPRPCQHHPHPTCSYPVRSPSVGGVSHRCSTGHFGWSGYVVPPPPVAVHHPAMLPTVPCILQPCIAFFRPSEPFDHPKRAPAVGSEMRLLCALPPCRIREHPYPTGVRYLQVRQLPPLCVCSWGSCRHRPPRPGG